MKIGIPKEIKDRENRVALTPQGAEVLIRAGHEVRVQAGAGLGAGFADQDYQMAGAQICSVEQAWDTELVVKVKEPLEAEYGLLRDNLLFTYLHLAGAPRELTDALLSRKTTGIAYETLEDSAGRLPLLAPMSAIAGNMATLMGAYYLARSQGGKGVQLGEVLGVRHGEVLIIGDGVVAYHAAKAARGLGAKVTIVGLDPAKGERMQSEIAADVEFVHSSHEVIAERVTNTDLLIGAVLKHGARAEAVVSEAMVKSMQPGSVVVDVSIDQGGCIATSRPTSHSEPIFVQYGVIHYCVTNMPGAYPRTSTLALTEATLPYVAKLAAHGIEALHQNVGMARSLNVRDGFIVCRPVAESLGMPDRYRDWDGF